MQFPIILPDFDPTLIAIGPIEIRWYSLAYIGGIMATLYLLSFFNKKEQIMPDKALENWMVWAVLGIILGGRLGYVFFYNFDYYMQNPSQILAVWQGGMSFHGGLLGSIISMLIFCKKYQIKFLKLTDLLSIAAPIGLFLGRIANFINMELYGRVTGSNFGVIFSNGGDLPRHPSQLYEAFLEGILAFIILFALAKLTNLRQKPGILSGLFLIIYASSRIFIEQFREPDQQLGFIFNYVTMGQILSIPLIIVGAVTIYLSLKRK